MGDATREYMLYLEKRDAYVCVVTACDKKIRRIFFRDRCLSGLTVLCSLIVLAGIMKGMRSLAVFAALVAIIVEIIRCVANPTSEASERADQKRRAEENIRILDATWLVFNE